jgi:hypothetical protein
MLKSVWQIADGKDEEASGVRALSHELSTAGSKLSAIGYRSCLLSS